MHPVTTRPTRRRDAECRLTASGMLDRAQLVIAGFEVAPSEYELWAISPETFKEHMRDSPTGKGRTGLVRKRVFTEHGKFVARVNIEKP